MTSSITHHESHRPAKPVPIRSLAPDPVVDRIMSQFARPQGPLGALAGRVMSRRRSNVERNRWMVELLELAPDSRVLELGPGPGVALQAATRVVTDNTTVAIDHSSVMLRQSAQHNRTAIRDGRLVLMAGSAEDLPATLGRFDRIYCMNVWQFWRDQERVTATLATQLSPGGRLAIGFQARRSAGAADTDAGARCLIDQLTDAGLIDIERFDLKLYPTPVALVIGRNPIR